MAKTIKFNLICDDFPVRTLEDLQNHFSVEDILAYYDNRMLHRWLTVRGYTKELEAVSNIQQEDPFAIAKELIRIFDISTDPQEVESTLYFLRYKEERQRLQKAHYKARARESTVLADHLKGYRQIKNGILQSPMDAAFIKASIQEMIEQYMDLFDLDHRALFYLFLEKSPLAVMRLLMNPVSRRYYIPQKGISQESKPEENTSLGTVSSYSYSLESSREAVASVLSRLPYLHTDVPATKAAEPAKDSGGTPSSQCDTAEARANQDQEDLYAALCKAVDSAGFLDRLGENLKKFSGNTDGYWKDLEPAGKQYMILKMVRGDYVRSAGLLNGDLAQSDVMHEFVILDGVDYKSNSARDVLLYMEV